MAAADPVKDGEFLDRVRKRAEAQRTAYEAEKLQDPESGATGG